MFRCDMNLPAQKGGDVGIPGVQGVAGKSLIRLIEEESVHPVQESILQTPAERIRPAVFKKDTADIFRGENCWCCNGELCESKSKTRFGIFSAISGEQGRQSCCRGFGGRMV